jgi:protein subunit release factor A
MNSTAYKLKNYTRGVEMKIMRISEKIGYIGKNNRQKQKMLTLGEAYSLCSLMEFRYDALITTKTLYEFSKDMDLKIIIERGINVLEAQESTLEKLMKEFLIPMPDKPPKYANISVDVGTITDKFIFRDIYNGLSNTMFKHISNYQRAHGSYLREVFRKFLIQEMDLYDEFYEYGKLKSYLHEQPAFRL